MPRATSGRCATWREAMIALSTFLTLVFADPASAGGWRCRSSRGGPGMPRRPYPCSLDDNFGTVRLPVIYRFDR